MGDAEADDAGDSLRLVPTMLASAGAGGLARFPCHPIDTVKARLQVQTWQALRGGNGAAAAGAAAAAANRALYRNFAHGLSDIWRQEGLRGLYRGFGPTVLGSMPASCLYFTSYEVSKRELGKLWASPEVEAEAAKGKVSFAISFWSGMLAETVSCVLWVPIDVIKERMQIQSLPRSSKVAEVKASQGDRFYASGYDALRSIVRTEGWRGFYRGYGATVMSFGPFSAMYFMFYEQFKSFAETLSSQSRQRGAVTDLPLSVLLGCGALAGASASLCTNPLDIVKLRLQVQRQYASSKSAPGNAASPSEQYKHMLDGLTKLVRHEGLRGMMQGVGARMAFHAPATAVNMALFEKLKGVTYALF
ncbi:Mitochondrial substrate carrier family protein E [Hondaea fermentalgiana]|uniref:Mitochondrial substrate carrier family protein E n=1 Tax=Hondaea fermentalgiana TaxID=2315210 RepID=A0A2R5G267_9STRA|nr:Mitochondrial substrate carrier family protein E [Hondaea fermentalgiana]|eukprot:GBG24409.1 Mitochondrial substrate carrier family protein E [Hondaea fermentalgiana]